MSDKLLTFISTRTKVKKIKKCSQPSSTLIVRLCLTNAKKKIVEPIIYEQELILFNIPHI